MRCCCIIVQMRKHCGGSLLREAYFSPGLLTPRTRILSAVWTLAPQPRTLFLGFASMTNASGFAPWRNFSLAQRKNRRSFVVTPASLSWLDWMVKMLDHSSPMADVRDELEARSRRGREIEVRNVAGSEMVPATRIFAMKPRMGG